MIVLDLVYKLALLVAFSIISGFISGKYSANSAIHKIFQGLLFGLASCIGMYHPFIFADGIIFDGRSILISLCTLFFGPEAGLINSVMTIAYRIYLGGSGTPMGIMVILSAFTIGLYFHHRKLKASAGSLSPVFLYIFGIIVHAVMLILVTTLPGKYILQTYQSVTFTVIGVYPVITLLIGRILDAFRENRKFIEDIKEFNRKLEEKVENRTAQLQEANKELEAYTYTISHDLRAPIRAINGFTGYLLEDYGKILDADGIEMVNMIRMNSARMGQLIDDLLDFSRVGNVSLKAGKVDMDKLVNETNSNLLNSSDRNIEFTCDKLGIVTGDESLLRQVWTNLLSNALKYTKRIDQPKISIRFRRDQESVIYSIQDNGIGFDMKYSDQLFIVFQRLHNSSEFEGSGVGLAIVKRIIERMGGKIWAEGIVNEGATFHFSLPYQSHPFSGSENVNTEPLPISD